MVLRRDPRTWEVVDADLGLKVLNEGGNSEGFCHRTFLASDWSMKFTFQAGSAIGRSGFQVWMDEPIGACPLDIEGRRSLVKQYIRLRHHNPYDTEDPPNFEEFYF